MRAKLNVLSSCQLEHHLVSIHLMYKQAPHGKNKNEQIYGMKSSRSSSKVVGLEPADLWEFQTLITTAQNLATPHSGSSMILPMNLSDRSTVIKIHNSMNLSDAETWLYQDS